jgi:hypothetical protein
VACWENLLTPSALESTPTITVFRSRKQLPSCLQEPTRSSWSTKTIRQKVLRQSNLCVQSRPQLQLNSVESLNEAIT